MGDYIKRQYSDYLSTELKKHEEYECKIEKKHFCTYRQESVYFAFCFLNNRSEKVYYKTPLT